MAPQSKVFCPFKAIGLVTSHRKLLLRYILSQRIFIIKVPVGNAFLVFRASNLSLMNVSDFHSSAVTCQAQGSPLDFTGTADGSIYCWSAFAHLIKKLEGHKVEIHSLTTIGSYLLSIDVNNLLKVWNVQNLKKSGIEEDSRLYHQMDLPKQTFDVTVAVHPPTYINKVLLGSRQGKLKLLNVRTNQFIYEFAGWGSAVTAIEAAPALDVVAIGLEDGRIIIHNLKDDQTYITLKQDWGKVTALSFRSDNYSRLLSGSVFGHVSLFDLDEKCLKSTIEKAHNGPIISLVCAQGDPVAYTSSTDNVIKSWIFDMPDGGGRLYCDRDGHSEPPLRARFHGAKGMTLISGGRDSNLRISSMITSKGQSMGLACYNRDKVRKAGLKCAVKMPPITHFTTEVTREEAWDSIAAIHLESMHVTTWSFHKKKMNDHFLVHERFKKEKYHNAAATCIEISVCGNYVFIGYDTGHVEKFNVQSGIHKKTYGKHETAVRGIVTDSLNHWVVSGAQDGVLQWFHMMKGEPDKTILLEGGVHAMNIHRESGLFAVALDDWSLYVCDVDTKSVVRKLYGHHNQITDMAFSSDSKWLITSSMDCSIRTWDLPTGSCIDHFLVPKPATSIDLSPIDDYLISTHVDELGIYVWANRNCLSFVSLQPLKEDHTPPVVNLPASTPDIALMEDSDSEEDDDTEEIDQDDYKSPEQISPDFVTINLMPTSRWLNLVNIDQIKKRNKPTEAPRVPKAAPFFLESASGVVAKLQESNSTEEKETQSKLVSTSHILEFLTQFGKLLKAEKHDLAFQILLKLSPSNIDMEIRELDPEVGGSKEAMVQFLVMIRNVIKRREHFEVAQGYLSLFMKRHSEFMTSDPVVKEIIQDLASVNIEAWHGLKDDINKSLCIVSYLKNTAILNY